MVPAQLGSKIHTLAVMEFPYFPIFVSLLRVHLVHSIFQCYPIQDEDGGGH